MVDQEIVLQEAEMERKPRGTADDDAAGPCVS